MAQPLVKTYIVPLELAAEIWPSIEEYVAGACRFHAFLEPHDLLRLIQLGFARLFIATGGSGVLGFVAAEVLQYPSRRVCNGMLAGGRRGFLNVLREDMLEPIQRWARDQGAEDICFTGRPGWQRLAAREGWTLQPQLLIHKRLDHGRRRQPINNGQQIPLGPGAAVSH